MSPPSPSDPRVRRTRRQLREAFLVLADEREIAAITVGDIAGRAGINRNTFYRHYRDKDELVAGTLDALFDELTAASRELVAAHAISIADGGPPTMVALFRVLGRHPRLYRRLLGEAGSTGFADRLRAFHERQFLQLWHDLGLEVVQGSPPVELRARLGATAVEGAIGWWLASDPSDSPERAATWTWQLLTPLWSLTVGPAIPPGDTTSVPVARPGT